MPSLHPLWCTASAAAVPEVPAGTEAEESAQALTDLPEEETETEADETETEEKEGIQLYRPHPALCTDNGAMVACAAYYKYKNGYRYRFNSR